MPPLTEAEIVDGSRQLTEDADVITGALEARKQAADRMREYAHQTADQAIAIAHTARARAEEAAKRAATNRVDAEVAYRRAREEVENARLLFDRHEGHAVAEKKDEWKECRVTIDRFDKLLVELRKTGVAFITALIGASALFLPKGGSSSTAPSFADHPWVKFSVFGAIVTLIVGIYLVDRIHQILLELTVRRAEELEQHMGYRLTQDLGVGVRAWLAVLVGVLLYVVMTVAVGVIFTISDTTGLFDMSWPPSYAQLVVTGSLVAVLFIISFAVFKRVPRGTR
jgi:hypothetical protein